MTSIDFVCSVCKSDLEATVGNMGLLIEPCERCLAEEHSDGYRDGYNDRENNGD